MGIRDREICIRTTGYFGPSVGRGHRLFLGLARRGHRLFQCKNSTGSQTILEYSQTGPKILLYENDVTVHHLPHFHAKAIVYSRHGLVFMLNFQKRRGAGSSTKHLRKPVLYWDFPGLSHIKNTGPEPFYTTGLTFILDRDGAMENFWPSGYRAIHYFAW